MTNAAFLTMTWEYYTDKREEQAKYMINHAKHLIIHEINKLVIFKLFAHFEVINKESFFIKFFDSEQEAVDYCLDIYTNSFSNKQTALFDNSD